MRNLKQDEPYDDKNVQLLKVAVFDGLLATVMPTVAKRNAVELHLSGRWLSGSAWPFW